MKFRLSKAQIGEEAAANLRAYERFDGFERDDAGWDEIWEGRYALLVDHKRAVRGAFGLDPRKSVLFSEFPHLLLVACDPQHPIIYSPVFGEFGYPVFDGGPSVTTLPFDPWTGKAPQPSVRGEYFSEAERQLGRKVGLLDEALDTLPDEFRSEAWWIERGL